MESVSERTIALSIHGRLGSSARIDTFELARRPILVATDRTIPSIAPLVSKKSRRASFRFFNDEDTDSPKIHRHFQRARSPRKRENEGLIVRIIRIGGKRKRRRVLVEKGFEESWKELERGEAVGHASGRSVRWLHHWLMATWNGSKGTSSVVAGRSELSNFLQAISVTICLIRE